MARIEDLGLLWKKKKSVFQMPGYDHKFSYYRQFLNSEGVKDRGCNRSLGKWRRKGVSHQHEVVLGKSGGI